ncbi:uncharacterized protein LOC109611401 [Ooceraea biroi]|uniref:uncharacterized protein LOC109611401 n=1 Tax=Ooceraea biroi TaxID=2015173 RepID=UPI000F086FB7|nr:uncharacterized protein LOC109611401 [Ooceraea biroi]
MPIDCYYLPPSPPCRTIVLLAKALGVHFNFKIVNVMSGDHMKAEYLQINPQHTIPTIDDNGFILWESRPIMIYLVSKYAKNDSLYPKDPKQKALVDQMIFFDAGSLYSNMGKCYLPVIKGLANSINEEDLKRVEKSFEVLNLFLEGRQFAAGENLSIADFTISTTICTILCFDFDISRYDNVAAYYERCKESLERYGFEEVHAVGVKAFTEIYHANLQESSYFKMPIDLYHTAVSGPCRAVRLVAAAVGVDLNLKNIDLRAGEHMTPEFLKINPQHTVPTLNDNGFYLWESRAIMTYLVNQYGKNDSLYPKDPKKRALVDQRLYFDMGTLYQSLGNYYRPIILENATPDQAKYEKICDALSLLDKFLEGENYVAGKTLTIADFALAVNVNNVKVQLISLIPNMPVQLYYMNMSPPCRAVVLVAETIGLELELIEMNILNGEHLTPEYEQINPQKTIPFMIDDDLKLSESRAIMCYLADQYGQDNNLYPQTPEARAVVNQRLYFDMDPLLSSISASYYPVFKKLADTCDPAQYEKMVNAFQLLDKFLEGQDYVAGNNLTIADCAMVASVAAAESFGFDVGNFENVSKWLENIKTTVPGYEKAIAEPIEAFKKIYLENSQGEHEEEEEKEEEE